MKFIIEIECDNAAFDDHFGIELNHILYQVAAKAVSMPKQETTIWLRDSNGNRVGTAKLVDD